MHGVMTPSPYSRPAPRIARIVSVIFSRLGRSLRLRGTSDSSEKMPPSPWLVARITTIRYFTFTVSMSAQKMSDSTPRMNVAWNSCAAPWCVMHSFSAYSGLVPMSPNTTPSAASDRAAVLDLCPG